MPDHCLVLISAPCVAEIDSDGELVLPASLSLPTLHTEEEHPQSQSQSQPQLLSCSATASSTGTGTGIGTCPTDCTHQVPVREYVEQTLQNLHQQRLVACAPCCLADPSCNSLQATLLCEQGDAVDIIMAQLHHIGVGSLVGSISVLSVDTCSFFLDPPKQQTAGVDKAEFDKSSSSGRTSTNRTCRQEDGSVLGYDLDQVEDSYHSHQPSVIKKKSFVESTSRLRIHQIVQKISNEAAFTFDYLSLLTVSSAIASIGLATNSVVVIVASMLVSPLMAPLLAMTFGTLVHDRKLTAVGMRHGACSLVISIFIGFLFGLVFALIGRNFSVGESGHTWPTDEMRQRGSGDGLLVGLAIAIPSGVGVALSVLGNNNASLIGVAISASLLPPAVNCGMTLAFALVSSLPITSNSFINNDEETFSSKDYLLLGALSLTLTLINVCAIFVSALGMFRLKEVAPVVNKVAFWNEDVKLCRGLNKQQKKVLQKEKKKFDARNNNPAAHYALSGSFMPFSSMLSSSLSGTNATTSTDLLTPPPSFVPNCQDSHRDQSA